MPLRRRSPPAYPNYLRNKPNSWVNGFGVVEYHPLLRGFEGASSTCIRWSSQAGGARMAGKSILPRDLRRAEREGTAGPRVNNHHKVHIKDKRASRGAAIELPYQRGRASPLNYLVGPALRLSS